MKPIVTIIGRPNVGKSTFFNRITKTRDAIVNNLPGITRDRIFGNALWNEKYFTVVDTGGFIQDDNNIFASDIRLQVKNAINDADIILVIFDGKTGASPFDMDIIKLLYNINKPVMYIVNKIDSPEQEYLLSDFYTFGIDHFYAISAEHGYGVSYLMDKLTDKFSYFSKTESDINLVRIAVVGRPNAGKSSLINSIIGESKLIVSNVPGTTRDTTNSKVVIRENSYIMVDTAGIRRKGKVSEKIEKFSIIKTLKRLNNCDIALIMIDAEQGISDQDIRIAGYAYDKGCGTLFVINKWDLVDNKNNKILKEYTYKLRNNAKFLSFAPIVSVSALTGLRLNLIFKFVDNLYSQYSTRIRTSHLNRIMLNATQKNEPPLHKGKKLKFYYTTQIKTKPPTIVSFVNYPNAVHFSYKRYLLNRLRKDTDLVNVPLKLIFRQRSGKNPLFLNKKHNNFKKRHNLRKKYADL